MFDKRDSALILYEECLSEQLVHPACSAVDGLHISSSLALLLRLTMNASIPYPLVPPAAGDSSQSWSGLNGLSASSSIASLVASGISVCVGIEKIKKSTIPGRLSHTQENLTHTAELLEDLSAEDKEIIMRHRTPQHKSLDDIEDQRRMAQDAKYILEEQALNCRYTDFRLWWSLNSELADLQKRSGRIHQDALKTTNLRIIHSPDRNPLPSREIPFNDIPFVASAVQPEPQFPQPVAPCNDPYHPSLHAGPGTFSESQSAQPATMTGPMEMDLGMSCLSSFEIDNPWAEYQ